jgi:hypothetical protein
MLQLFEFELLLMTVAPLSGRRFPARILRLSGEPSKRKTGTPAATRDHGFGDEVRGKDKSRGPLGPPIA